jgi:hypothetical protein
MGVKMKAWLLYCLWGIAMAAQAKPAETDFRSYTPVQNLKSYALTICLARGFADNKPFNIETHVAARAYIDFGKFGIDAYNEAAALATRFVAKNYESENGEKLTILKCIDLFHSAELASLAKKYQRLRDKSGN